MLLTVGTFVELENYVHRAVCDIQSEDLFITETRCNMHWIKNDKYKSCQYTRNI